MEHRTQKAETDRLKTFGTQPCIAKGTKILASLINEMRKRIPREPGGKSLNQSTCRSVSPENLF